MANEAPRHARLRPSSSAAAHRRPAGSGPWGHFSTHRDANDARQRYNVPEGRPLANCARSASIRRRWRTTDDQGERPDWGSEKLRAARGRRRHRIVLNAATILPISCRRCAASGCARHLQPKLVGNAGCPAEPDVRIRLVGSDPIPGRRLRPNPRFSRTAESAEPPATVTGVKNCRDNGCESSCPDLC